MNYELEVAIADAWSQMNLDKSIIKLYSGEAPRDTPPPYVLFDTSTGGGVEERTMNADGIPGRSRRVMNTEVTFSVYQREKDLCGQLARKIDLVLSRDKEKKFLNHVNNALADLGGGLLKIDYVDDAPELEDDDEWMWESTYEFVWWLFEYR